MVRRMEFKVRSSVAVAVAEAVSRNQWVIRETGNWERIRRRD